MALARQLSGMPRHLSIHVGGFVITHGPLVSMAPVEAGSMTGAHGRAVGEGRSLGARHT
jgi:error-prone DNA polymerase